MYGIEAISFHNGWAMALVGALIVFAGLVVLTTAISQLHKILMLWEKKDIDLTKDHKIPKDDEPEEELGLSLPKYFPSDICEVALLYKPLIEKLGETFYLSDLYKLSRKNDYPNPHVTLTDFRASTILIPHGDGVFTWNQPLIMENDKG